MSEGKKAIDVYLNVEDRVRGRLSRILQEFCVDPSPHLWNNLSENTRRIFMEVAQFCIKRNVGNLPVARAVIKITRERDVLQRFKTDHFRLVVYKSTLGRGFQGTVYETTLKERGKRPKDVATKRIKRTKLKRVDHLVGMIQRGSDLGISPHLYGVFYTADYIYLVMDKLDGFWGNLWPRMNKDDFHQLAHIFDIMIQHNIYNVDGDYGYRMIDGHRKWYIVDWGVSKVCDDRSEAVEEFQDYFDPSIGMSITPMLQIIRAQMRESLK